MMSAVWLLAQVLCRAQEPICSCQLVPSSNNSLNKFVVVISKLLSNGSQLSIASVPEVSGKHDAVRSNRLINLPTWSAWQSKLLPRVCQQGCEEPVVKLLWLVSSSIATTEKTLVRAISVPNGIACSIQSSKFSL